LNFMSFANLVQSVFLSLLYCSIFTLTIQLTFFSLLISCFVIAHISICIPSICFLKSSFYSVFKVHGGLSTLKPFRVSLPLS